MSKNIKTLIIAMGVLLLLSGMYYWSTARNNRKADPAPPDFTPSPSLGNLESYKLAKIELSSLALEKNNGTWELVSLEGGNPPGGIELDQVQIQYMTYSLASVWAERIVDEEPSDLSQYGLDKPSHRTIVTDSAGETAEYILGDMTPSRLSYYIMEAGDPKVYSVSYYTVEYMLFTLDNIRQRFLFPAFDLSKLAKFRLESRLAKIEINAKPQEIRPDLIGNFSSHLVTSPYIRPRGTNSEALNSLLAPFMDMEIVDFIDDAPSSLKPYGLDDPVRISLDTEEKSIDLLIGKEFEWKHYAKLADAPGVFTLSDMGSVINARPFNLIDKFTFIINIDWVDHLSISGGEKNLSADLRKEGDESVFFLNGKKTDTDSFRVFYQAVIGLMVDAEYPGAARQNDNSGELTVEYQLNNPPGERATFTLIPYNRDFYALKQDGVTEFLISRNQVRRIYETADAMIYSEN
jgi:hypothetical protein